jgi:hypothetical protein
MKIRGQLWSGGAFDFPAELSIFTNAKDKTVISRDRTLQNQLQNDSLGKQQ